MSKAKKSYEVDDSICGYHTQTQLVRELRRLRSCVNLEKIAPTLFEFCEIIPTLIEEHIYQRKVNQFETQIKEFKKEHLDFDDFLPEIKRVLTENPNMGYLSGGLERAYSMAKEKYLS